VLFEYFHFLVIPLLLDQEAIVVPDLDLGTLALYLLDQPLEFRINHLHVFDPAQLHLPEHLLAIVDEVHRSLAVLLKLSDDLLAVLFEDVDALFLLDKAVAAVVDDAVDADEAHASIAEMLHQLLWMIRAKVGLLEHLLLSLRVVKCDEILGQFLWLEGLGDRGSADRADRQPLLLDLNQALFAKGVATVEIPWNPICGIEVFVTRGAIHYSERLAG